MKCASSMLLCAGLILTGAVCAQEGVSVAQQGLTATSADQVLRDAEGLVKAGKAAEAYALLLPLEFDRAGETRFDYLLGIAALESGKPDKATLALERALTVDAGFTAARLEMARAYYQLGDLPRAQSEFNITLQQNPAPATRSLIQKYLDEIALQSSGKRTRVSAYVQAGVGRDTNVNNSTSQTQILVPFAGNAPASLDPTNVKSADNYYGAAAGAEVIHSLNHDWSVYAGGDVSQRGFNKQTRFDALSVNGRAGVLLGTESSRLRVGLSAGQYNLGRTRNRDVVGAEGEWRYVLNAGNQMSVFGQATQYRYAEPAMKLNDFNQHVIGAGWLHAYADGRSTMTASLYHGTENDASKLVNPATLTAGRTDGGKRFNGVRIGGQTPYDDNIMLTVSAGGQSGSYANRNPYFLVQRADRQLDLTVGANWNIAPLWSLRPQLAYVRNNSNIVIYRYNRVDAALMLRRDFK